MLIGQIRCQEVDLRYDEEVDRPEEGVDLSGGEEIILLLEGQYLDAVVGVGVVVNLHVVGWVQNNLQQFGGVQVRCLQLLDLKVKDSLKVSWFDFRDCLVFFVDVLFGFRLFG